MCPQCNQLQCTVSDVSTNGDAQHLFLVTAPLCQKMVGVLRAGDVHRCISELDKELPSRLQLITIYYGQGHRAEDVYYELKAFRADCPGHWYHMYAQAASHAISNMLFGENTDSEGEPGIVLEEVTVTIPVAEANCHNGTTFSS